MLDYNYALGVKGFGLREVKNNKNFPLILPPFFPSAFHLSYNMILNQLRSEDSTMDILIQRSFAQFQATRALPQLKVSLQLNLIFFSFLLHLFPSV